MTVAETINNAVSWAEAIAADDSHTYSQDVRWGPSYDCSSLVISAWEHAGVPLRSKGASHTGNMAAVMLANGFERITSNINFSTGSGFKRGDVILDPLGDQRHVAMSVGNGKIVEAYGGPNPANSIRVTNYYRWGQDRAYRYVGKGAVEEPSFKVTAYPRRGRNR